MVVLIKKELDDFLKDYEKVLVLGIGNELRQDDGLGPYFIKSVSNFLDSIDDSLSETNDYSILKNKDISLIDAGHVPENFTGKIKEEKPSHIFIVDAVIGDKSPGEITIVNREQIPKLNVSTHAMSLNTLIKYLESYFDFKVIFIGIEPKFMNLGMEISNEVLEGLEELKFLILDALIKN